jgi:CubicO group peptidase (beta-lactamase class C family)
MQQNDYLNYDIPYSAGISSTTEDLLKWMRALHTGKVLSALHVSVKD